MGCSAVPAAPDWRSRFLGVTVVAVALLLLAPLGEALLVMWSGAARHSVASIFAAAATVMFAVIHAREIARGRRGAAPLAIGGLGLATAVYVYTMRIDVWFIAGLAAVGIGASLIRLFHGRDGVRAAAPAIAMSLFVAPMPGSLVQIAQTWLSFRLADALGWTMSVIHGEVVRVSGTFVHLPTTDGPIVPVPIVDDCSGVGGLAIATPFAVLLLLLARIPFGWRWLLGISAALACTAAANFARVFVMGSLVTAGRSDLVATGWIHELLGVVPLLVAGGATWWLVRFLERRRRRELQREREGVA